jgi:hypothetical protein
MDNSGSCDERNLNTKPRYTLTGAQKELVVVACRAHEWIRLARGCIASAKNIRISSKIIAKKVGERDLL